MSETSSLQPASPVRAGSRHRVGIAALVLVTVVWCGVGSVILFKITDVIVGLRVPVEAEREGLDLASHGEAAYHN